MTRAVRWLFAVCLCTALASLVPLYAQPEPAAEGGPAALPAAVEPSPLLKEPETPEEMFDAAVLLIELARFDLAKLYLQQFADSNPTDELLQTLRDRHGSGEFLQMTNIPELKAVAQPLLDRLNEASRKQAEDAGYIDSLIARLAGTPTEREIAIRELRNAGVRAVPQMLRQLAGADALAPRDMIVLALSRMGQPVVPALIAALDSNNDPVRLGCIEALSSIRAEAAVPRLWSLAYGPTIDAGTQDAARRAIAQIRYDDEELTERLSDVAAANELQARAEQLLAPDAQLETEEGSTTLTVWTWLDGEQTLLAKEVPPAEATLTEALRSAREAFALGGDRAEIQTLFLTALFATEVQRVGWDQTLTAENSEAMQTAVATGVEPLLRVLQRSLETGRTDGAWAALQGLSSLASTELIRNRSGQPSVVVSALNYPDPRVQFAAAVVVMRSDPRLAFASAGRVMEVFRRALTDPGPARAIVINPDPEEGALLGNYLSDEGFDPMLTRTGREGFVKAAETTGVQVIVMHANVSNWSLTQTLANLRADSRTAYLPVVVYGPESVRAKTARLVSRTGRTLFAAEAPAAESFWLEVRPFLSQGSTPPMSGLQRGDFRAIAAYWLATLASGPASSVFDLATAEAELLPLVQEEGLALNALVALGHIGTASVQTALGEFALNNRLPPVTRRAAAGQLVSHIQRYGLLISADEAAALTAGWEQTADAEIKAALAAVVGSLKPNAGLVGERLRRLSIVPTP